MQVVHFKDWINSIRPQLQPPVGNKLLHGDGQLKIMVVGGPNVREDYHIEEGEEIFMQLEGSMVLKIIENNKPKDVVINEGELFVLPSRIPHSPQRLAGTIGLVIERERLETETDCLRYYERNGSGNILYEEWFHCYDLGKQLKPVIERFFSMDISKTGIRPPNSPPFAPAPFELSNRLVYPSRNLSGWLQESFEKSTDSSSQVSLFGKGSGIESNVNHEFQVIVHRGGNVVNCIPKGETFIYQLDGSDQTVVTIFEDASKKELKSVHNLTAGCVFLIASEYWNRFSVDWAHDGYCLEISNSVTV
jgi:3-hydroxyanthranilate 3,4-dioxygenase